jgi:hypothetical protein
MKQMSTTVCQYRKKLAWGHPYPTTNQDGGSLGKEVANLPDSVPEDVAEISLCPKYSEKKLRRINRLYRAKHDGLSKGLNKIQRKFVKNKSDWKYLTVKRTLAEEVM